VKQSHTYYLRGNKHVEDDLWTEGRRRMRRVRTIIHNPHCCTLCFIRRAELHKRCWNKVYCVGNNPYISRCGKARLGWRVPLTHFQCKNNSQKTTSALYSCIKHYLTSPWPKEVKRNFWLLFRADRLHTDRRKWEHIVSKGLPRCSLH
jgi:hypothetical protein